MRGKTAFLTLDRFLELLIEGGTQFMEPHQKRISMSIKITRNFKIGTLHIIAIYLLASQKTNSINIERRNM